MSVAIELPDDDRLESVLAAAEEGTAEPVAALVPSDLPQATRLVRRLARIRHQQAEIRQAAQQEIDRISAWRDAEEGRLEKQAAFLEWLLHSYHQATLARDPRAKTIRTPYGELKARRVPAQPKLVDEAAVLAWAKTAAPEYVQVKESLRWGELKKALSVTEDGRAVAQTTGEVLPADWITAQPERVDFSVSVEEVL